MSAKNEVRNFIVQNFLYGQDNNFDDDVSFLDKGIIDSISIIELVAFTEDKFGITVEQEELVPENFDSLAKLTYYIEKKQNNGKGPIYRAPLAPVRDGSLKSPLFWLGLNTSLPRYIGTDQPVCKIILQGQYGKNIVYKSLEELVAYHLNEIRILQPKGPYLLGGYCLSAVVALEIARQLIREGEEVSLLCMVEPPLKCLPSDPYKPSTLPNVSLTSRVKHFRGNGVNLRPAEITAAVLIKIRKTLRKIKLAACKAILFFKRPIPPSLRDFYYSHTLDSYVPQVYPGKAVIFLDDISCGAQPDWKRLAGDELRIHEVQGAGHFNIIKEPYVSIWAKQLSSYVDEIQKSGHQTTAMSEVSISVI